MRLFIEHLKTRTIPHELLEDFLQAGVPFYDGCLIVEIHDHRSANKAKETRPGSTASMAGQSIHNYNQCLTPSPLVPFPKESSGTNGRPDSKAIKNEDQDEKEKEKTSLNGSDQSKTKKPAERKVFTTVLRHTPETLQRDLQIKSVTPAGQIEGREDTNGVPPSTPMSLVPPTPTASTMPPPAKRQKKEKPELDASQIPAAEGQILLATMAPLVLEPTKSVEETILLLEAMSHPEHMEAPPQPKTRKRTVAEMAADEAAAAEQERYLLLCDERLASVAVAQKAGGADGDAQVGAAGFEPRFERFKVIADIKREHLEKKEAEKAKQAENDRRLRQQQQEAAQKQQQAEAEKARREAAALRERQLQEQRQMAAARAASTPQSQNTQANNTQPQHGHLAQNGNMSNGVPNNAGAATPVMGTNGMATNGMAAHQARFQAQMQNSQAGSPIIRQGTPQNHSSPMVNNGVPMQQTSSAMAASPPRPPSVAQNGPMAVPMAHNMSARGSQQSHAAGTPRMPHSTPQLTGGTPVNRSAMVATPRMTQASPPPNMMAQNSQMGQQMMMNQQGITPQHQHQQQLIAQMAAQQRSIAQQQNQQQQSVGGQGTNVSNLTPQQQHYMMQMAQRQQQQQMLQQQQHQAQQQQAQQAQQQQHPQHQQNGMLNQQQIAQQYAQLQNMQGHQMRQLPPQMQAQLQQQMARMQQMGGMNMQRQASQMNGQNPNMQAMALQIQQQQQQQQAQQQAQHQQQQQMQAQQQGQQGVPNNGIPMAVQPAAKSYYQRMMTSAINKYGSREAVPPEIELQARQQSLQHGQQAVQHMMQQRRNQALMMQQQQQQQAAMQGMGGMMGQQGM